jgi:putative lipoic acid-binding regulatory protein
MSDTPLIQFPCDFPIKIMGLRTDSFIQTVLEIVLVHAPDFVASRMTIQPSSQGKYLSLTCTIHAQSREQLDALYRDLSTHPAVKLVL